MKVSKKTARGEVMFLRLHNCQSSLVTKYNLCQSKRRKRETTLSLISAMPLQMVKHGVLGLFLEPLVLCADHPTWMSSFVDLAVFITVMVCSSLYQDIPGASPVFPFSLCSCLARVP